MAKKQRVKNKDSRPICKKCKGNGWKISGEEICPECQGAGRKIS